MSDPITEITATVVRKPLPRELRLGSFRVRERIYAVASVRTRSGLQGFGYGQTRGAPVAEIIDSLLAPALAGTDSSAIEARWRDCYRATIGVGRTGLVMRALSLIDIALWDIQAQRAGLPLHKLLGGVRDTVPVMFVAAYPSGHDDIDETAEAAAGAAAAGHRLIKIARTPDPAVTREILTRLTDQLPAGARIVVDASWVWERPDQALAELRAWPAERIAWLEDPFPPEAATAYSRLRAASPLPVGAGDEVTDPGFYDAASAVLDVLRLDVATIGGVTAAVRVIHGAERQALPVSTHICPEVSAHLAAAFPAVTCIETFDRSGNRYDPSHELFSGGPVIKGGVAILPQDPGLDLAPCF